MGRTGHRVLAADNVGGEEAQDVLRTAPPRRTRHDHTSSSHRGEERQIGFQLLHHPFGRHLDEDVAVVAADEDHVRPEADEPGHRLSRLHRFGRKVHPGIRGVWNRVVALSGLLLEPGHLLGFPLPKVEIRRVLASKPFGPRGGGPRPEGPVHP